MTTLYDKQGNSFKVPHKIDVKDWLAMGFTLEQPTTKPIKEKKETKEV